MVDLFNLHVSEDRLHKNFKNLLADKDLMGVLERWAIGFQDRDNKFVKEFQTTFNSSFWELYLYACFRNLGFNIDISYHAPDFVLTTRNTKETLLVEAVTTRHPSNGSPEDDFMKKLEQVSMAEDDLEAVHSGIVHLATERIASSIKDKYEKYLRQYSKLEHVKTKPFLLAVGSFEQPLFYNQGIGAIERVVYGLTKAEYQNGYPFMEYSDHIIKESSGASIPIGIFNDERYENLSGIIFSPVATAGKVRALSLDKNPNTFFETYSYNDYQQQGLKKKTPHNKYRESLLDGMSIYMNPFAKCKINIDDFDNHDICIRKDRDSVRIKHGFLYSRSVSKFE